MDSADSPCASSDASCGGGRRDRALWFTLTLATAALLAAIVVYGPPVLRRPLLTPLVSGMVMGLLSRALLKLTGGLPVGRFWILPGIAGIILTVLTHGLMLNQLQSAARERVHSNPREAQLLQAFEELAGEKDLGPELRDRRLQWQPRWRDYFAARSAALLGERPWPVPLILVGIEGFACAVAAVWGFRRAGGTTP